MFIIILNGVCMKTHVFFVFEEVNFVLFHTVLSRFQTNWTPLKRNKCRSYRETAPGKKKKPLLASFVELCQMRVLKYLLYTHI